MRFLYLFCGLTWLLTTPGHGQTVTFGLPPLTAPLPSTAFHFDRLVDARPDRTRLGSVHRGVGNKLVSADFGQPLEAELTPWLQQALPATAATRPVVVRVHTLSVGEIITPTSETAAAELVIDFLEPVGADAYRLVLSTGELVESNGIDVTKHHPKNLRIALEQSLRKLAAQPAASDAAPTLSWTQVLAGVDGVAPERYPVQQQPLRPGVYKSFEEFRANAPTLQEGPLEIVKTPRKGREWAGTNNVEAYYLYLDPNHQRRPVRDAWGLSDGQTAYIRYRNRYFPLTPAGPDYTFTGFRIPDPNEQLAGVALGAMFGLAGALVAAATLPSGTQPQRYDLHLTSGRVVATERPNTTPDGFVRADTAAIYLYRRPDAQSGQPVRVQLNGREVGQLTAGSYLALSWTDRQQQLRICVGSEQETCRAFVPDFTTATYLECSLPSAISPVPSLTPVAEKEGVFYVKKYRSRLR
ncbi:hypothetical protein CDA63_09095 [Hymenobacter amundsenii]|uniref:Uncharacterized protein n=1 Tax=Hymenobacter amundsenii TaxID=2006685 RepID=A0A246FNL7_9BACT|nr:hypothetical protein [Hymenobacter amundsenii]OWP63354.1 hypothetical protein CDA63_09095 [Hymenobacter amundsenii]